MRRIGILTPLGQTAGRIGGLPQGRGGCPWGRKTSSTSAQFCQTVGASLPITPPEAGAFRERKVSHELKSKACCRLSKSNGGTAVSVHGRPLASKVELIGALGGVMLQLFTTGLIGGGVGFGIGLGCVCTGPAPVGAAGCCFCRPPSTGTNNTSTQR